MAAKLDAAEIGALGTSSRKYEQKREDLLSAAAAVFNREGVRGATLADVAAAVGLNIKSLRYYFTRKDDLTAATFLRAIQVYSALISEASLAGSVEDRINTFISLYFDLTRKVVERKAPPFLHFGDLRSLTEPQAGPVFAAFNTMFRKLRQLIATPGLQALGRPALNARTHLLLSQVLWSVIWTQRYDSDELARAGERMSDILINGFVPAGVVWKFPRLRDPSVLPRSKNDSRQAFLRAATVLINDQGYHGASIDRIAASLSMTKGAFYHYHDAKDDLVVACFERTFEVIRSAQRSRPTGEQALDKVAGAADALVRLQLSEDGPLLRTSALTAVPLTIRREMEQRLDRITARFSDLLSDGIVEGCVRPCDAAIGAQMITATINSAEELPRWIPSTEAADAQTLYVAPTFAGLLSL